MVTLAHISLYLFSLFLAFAMSFLFNFLFSLTTFYITYFWGFAVFKNALVRLFTGALIPLAFFPAGFGKILSYLPFAGMISTPITLYLGQATGMEALRLLGLQVFWVLFFLVCVRLAWKRAVSHLTVMGG